ncbi:hypothetical protein GQ55_3G388400 [Panicum hallii var. hallii]|uniref:Uncharacterized protein n=1 Tax=Panicum hallii var. hallii TaxID=1504633 RepID=A0A2T7EGG8_9POAL|nr:hypothetical protein GQ55_3G388400 [Panicum hallii var. hallii]PUZ66926.1 hypothetical protein GQ55_3G388400 [Panicum hallii var. hallii]
MRQGQSSWEPQLPHHLLQGIRWCTYSSTALVRNRIWASKVVHYCCCSGGIEEGNNLKEK